MGVIRQSVGQDDVPALSGSPDSDDQDCHFAFDVRPRFLKAYGARTDLGNWYRIALDNQLEKYTCRKPFLKRRFHLSSPDQEARMREYATRYGLKFNIKEQLGEGTDGAVWATSNNSVIKVIEREKTFETEFRCYERLMSHRVKVVDGLNVPSLIECSRELKIIEMSLVHPP